MILRIWGEVASPQESTLNSILGLKIRHRRYIMSITHPEFTAAAPRNGRLENDGTRQQGLASDASGR